MGNTLFCDHYGTLRGYKPALCYEHLLCHLVAVGYPPLHFLASVSPRGANSILITKWLLQRFVGWRLN